MTKEEFRNQYATYMYQKMLEKDPFKRSEIDAQIKRIETEYKRTMINQLLNESEPSNQPNEAENKTQEMNEMLEGVDNISNQNSIETTGGKSK